MGSAKHELSRLESCKNAAIEIHRKVKNVSDSLNSEPGDTDNNDMQSAYALAGSLWNKKDPLVRHFNSSEELRNAIGNCLKTLPFVSDMDDQIFDRD